MLRKIIIMSLFVFQLSMQVFAYNENDLGNIELSRYGRVYTNEDFGTRLRRIETDIFGMAQSGDLDKRMNMIQQMTSNEKSVSVVPYENIYTEKKQNPIKRFFSNMTLPSYYPGVVTGYTPGMNTYGYNNIYRNEYSDFMNNHNNFCPFNNQRLNNIPGRYHNHYYNGYGYNNNRYLNNNRTGHVYPYNNAVRPYRYNPYYNKYPVPTDVITNVATRSAVHILQD